MAPTAQVDSFPAHLAREYLAEAFASIRRALDAEAPDFALLFGQVLDTAGADARTHAHALAAAEAWIEAHADLLPDSVCVAAGVVGIDVRVLLAVQAAR